MVKLNLKPNTFYRRIKEYETQISNSESTPIVKWLPQNDNVMKNG